MSKFYNLVSKKTALVTLAFSVMLFVNQHSSSQSNSTPNGEIQLSAECHDCETNCFSSEISSQTTTDGCITRTLTVNAGKNCKHALSHYVVQVKCGIITEASNSGGWPMELNKRDPKSGIWGLKIDNIQNFGDYKKPGTFTVTYTVCAFDSVCLDVLKKESFKVVYKASTCQFVEKLTPEDDPVVENPLVGEIIPTHISCFGLADGRIAVSVSGGTPPYSFVWSNGSTTQNLQGLVAGTYSVVVTDAQNQQLNLSTLIKQADRLYLTGTATPTSCTVADGKIDLTLSGGTMPYSFQWNNGDTIQNLTELGTGTYLVKVTDANGCLVSKSFTVSQATDLNAVLTGSTLECHQEGQGQIVTTVSGGTAPYSFAWSNGQTTSDITQLNSGRYQVSITDQEGCSVMKAAYVNIKTLSASATVTSPDCYGESTGTATLNIVNGTAPYSIQWSNGASESTIDGLSTGWYTVNISDANACTYFRKVFVSEPAKVSLNYQSIQADCSGSSTDMLVILNGTGGTSPYTYWMNGEMINDTLSLAPGNYDITVVDAKGCSSVKSIQVEYSASSFSSVVNVVQPTCSNPLGTVSISVLNGLQPYSALWSDGYTGMTRSEVLPGIYSVTVSDAKGCSQTKVVDVKAVLMPEISIQPAQPDCGTDQNEINAVATNVATFDWQLLSDSSDWYIMSQSGLYAVYHAGNGQATFILTGTSADGCSVTDTLRVACTQTPDDGDDNDDDGDDTGNCDFSDNFWIESVAIADTKCHCVTYKMVVKTDGLSEHELSHLVVGIQNGSVSQVSNSRNWPVETNMTDPKSGVYGFKIDNISGFGQSGADYFKVYFTVCYDGSIPEEEEFTIVYKASTCLEFDSASVKQNGNDPCVHVDVSHTYHSHDTWFDFYCSRDTRVELCMYDSHGNKIKTLFDHHVKKNERHRCGFNSSGREDRLFFYQLRTKYGVKAGKIMKCY